MRKIDTLVFNDTKSDRTIFTKIADDLSGFRFEYTNDMEHVIEAINARKLDLLVIDTNLPKEQQNKLNKLITLIDPELATLDLHMNDEAFMTFKLKAMQQQWDEAQTGGGFNFIDGPSL